MAVSTSTASLAQAGVQPKGLHAGPNVVRSVYVGSAHTVSDIILMCKVPNGATIVDVHGYTNTAETTATVDIGLRSVAQDNLIDGGAKGAQRMVLPKVRLSLTDNADPQYDYVQVTLVTASFTTTFTIDLTVEYALDQIQT